jgi:hypothetical protein
MSQYVFQSEYLIDIRAGIRKRNTGISGSNSAQGINLFSFVDKGLVMGQSFDQQPYVLSLEGKVSSPCA